MSKTFKTMNDQYEKCWKDKYYPDTISCDNCPHKEECDGSDWIEEGIEQTTGRVEIVELIDKALLNDDE